MMETTKTFVKENWKAIVKAALVVAFAYFAYGEYQDWKQQKQVPVVQTVTLPPQAIHTTTETVREVAVQAPSHSGSGATVCGEARQGYCCCKWAGGRGAEYFWTA